MIETDLAGYSRAKLIHVLIVSITSCEIRQLGRAQPLCASTLTS